MAAALALVTLLGAATRPAEAQSRLYITGFDAEPVDVAYPALADGTARIDVTWSVANRPPRTQLVFEQVFADGTVRNAELPRNFLIVPNSGDGVMAPIAEAGQGQYIWLQVRLVDRYTYREYDRRTLRLSVYGFDETPPLPQIVIDTRVDEISRRALIDGTARIPVNWRVDNRPPNTNLVFEQVLPGGGAVNVELPRDFSIIPSSGEGVVAPVLPGEGANRVELRVRLIDLRTGDMLYHTAASVAIIDDPADPAPGTDIRLDVQPRAVASDGTVTVSWSVPGTAPFTILYRHANNRYGADDIRDYAVDPARDPTQPLPRSGDLAVTLPPATRHTEVFIFIEDRGAVEPVIAIAITCTHSWFAPQPLGPPLLPDTVCPPAAPTTIQGAYQRFERGFMIWNPGEIWVFYDNGGGAYFPDAWDGTPVQFTEDPPPGRVQPVRGFGNLWVNRPALRENLGWATAAEQGYTLRLQTAPYYGTGGGRTGDYALLELPDGAVIGAFFNRHPNGGGITWTR